MHAIFSVPEYLVVILQNATFAGLRRAEVVTKPISTREAGGLNLTSLQAIVRTYIL